MSHAELPLPSHYRAEHAASFAYQPDPGSLLEAATAFRQTHRVAAASEDATRVRLLLVDVQKDFCFPEGSLFVAGRSGTGALEDNRRVAEFIYRNLGQLTELMATLDTHHPVQIFFPAFWQDASGKPLHAHRTVSVADLTSGLVRPNPALAASLTGGDVEALNAQALHYVKELERQGRYTLYLWPPHCLLGTDGHALVGVIQEARLFHTFVRHANNPLVTKGEHPFTENYSVLSPEVLTRPDGSALAEPDHALLEVLLESDRLIICGEAASHCVRSTVDHLLEAIRDRDPTLASRVYLLTDCMSSVAVPDGKGGFLSDFTAETEAALQRYAEAGMHLVTSTTPMAEWP
jgi:nicotinamidase-related amidase